MNLLEHNRDNYLRHAHSNRRIALIVIGVVVTHVVVITAVARWHGWMPKQGEGLIHVAIFADTPHTPVVAAPTAPPLARP